jgi:hypothetical protein
VKTAINTLAAWTFHLVNWVNAISPYVPSRIRSIFRGLKRRRRRRAIVHAHFSLAHSQARQWIRQQTEESNFTYELTPESRLYLTHFVAFALNASLEQVQALFDELDSDNELRSDVSRSMRKLIGPDAAAEYGRRIAWYAITRLVKPNVVVETGVAHGLGACVLCAALLRNANEGHPGRYIGTDVWTAAGAMLGDRYRGVATVLYGDSVALLRNLACTIDLFINDSNHSYDYEMMEYATVRPKLSDRAILIGDNCLDSTALARFSGELKRRFIMTCEQPRNHWYSGAAIGLSLPPHKIQN